MGTNTTCTVGDSGFPCKQPGARRQCFCYEPVPDNDTGCAGNNFVGLLQKYNVIIK